MVKGERGGTERNIGGSGRRALDLRAASEVARHIRWSRRRRIGVGDRGDWDQGGLLTRMEKVSPNYQGTDHNVPLAYDIDTEH